MCDADKFDARYNECENPKTHVTVLDDNNYFDLCIDCWKKVTHSNKCW